MRRGETGRGAGIGEVAALLLALAGALAACAPGRAPAQPPLVIVISMDGTRHDYPDRGPLPAMTRMEREGARAERLVPVFPASTFPNHVSLATGTYVDRHGIVANRFRDPGRGEFDYDDDASWIRAEPIWVTAERQGVRAAVYFWVGSGTDWRGAGASERRAPFSSRVSERAKVDQILEWVRRPAATRPGLILSWWHGADAAGHRHGPDHPRIAEQLARQDAQLGRLLAGLDALDAWSWTTLLLVSDHGMTAVDDEIDLARWLRDAGIGAWVVPAGGAAYVHLDDPAQRAEALARIRALDGVEAWPSDALPPGLRAAAPGRSGQVVALASPPRRLVAGRRRLPGAPRGGHGYAGDHPDMGAIFLALGRGVTPGARPGAVRAIDVAPTVSALLGIDPPASSEGRALLGRAPADPESR